MFSFLTLDSVTSLGPKSPYGAKSTFLQAPRAPTASYTPNAWTLDSFEIGRRLGRGGFGRVYMARTKEAPKFILALKCLYKAELKEEHAKEQLCREMEIQKELRHPNVLRLYGFFHDENRVFLMLELAPKGDIFKRLTTLGRFSEEQGSQYISQVVAALQYLHSKHVIHRDIKPENLLLGLDGEVKIADFGCSVQQTVIVLTRPTSRMTFCGTLGYMAPEMIAGEPCTEKVDHWALGVLAYEFLVGNVPFEANSFIATCQRIVSVDLELPSHISPEACDFIELLLHREPERRPLLSDAASHPWITGDRFSPEL
ncbi:kinase-like domain-containing protein [Cantharellus anzutake]|uniref:kinase-like domain-containing protein n=1 Tax=Cantharellus anzutake TaxID=1750568 RepID=UPI0019080CB4|nr:kinase-like domain-containing protein [Cantharellus anzutake]KAF8305079.1 kinase-like domain-containing protein [Cantharellus anzutake]